MSRVNHLRPRTLALLVFASSSAAACGLVALGDRLARVERRQAAESLARAVAANIDHELASVQVPPAVLGTLVSQLGRPPADLERVAGELLAYSGSVDSVQLAPGGVIGFIQPLPGNEAALGLDLLARPGRTARPSRRPGRSGGWSWPAPSSSARGAWRWRPARRSTSGVAGEERFWGVASAIIRLPRLLAESGLGRLEAAGLPSTSSRGATGGARRDLRRGRGGAGHGPGAGDPGAAPAGWTLSVEPRGGWGPSWITWMALAASLLATGVDGPPRAAALRGAGAAPQPRWRRGPRSSRRPTAPSGSAEASARPRPEARGHRPPRRRGGPRLQQPPGRDRRLLRRARARRRARHPGGRGGPGHRPGGPPRRRAHPPAPGLRPQGAAARGAGRPPRPGRRGRARCSPAPSARTSRWSDAGSTRRRPA